jgi:hypothetical protein
VEKFIITINEKANFVKIIDPGTHLHFNIVGMNITGVINKVDLDQ